MSCGAGNSALWEVNELRDGFLKALKRIEQLEKDMAELKQKLEAKEKPEEAPKPSKPGKASISDQISRPIKRPK